MWRRVVFLLGTTALVSCGAAPPHPDPAADRTAIEAALRQWPNDFNAKSIGGVCGLFADDAVLAAPDGDDRNKGEFCTGMQRLFDDPAKKYAYGAPDIREVLVDGNLATVKLFWTLTVTDPAGKTLSTGVEDGLDVFVRQPDGSWKIHVSHAFTK